jgi:type II secretory pathway pseudopilin PulG
MEWILILLAIVAIVLVVRSNNQRNLKEQTKVIEAELDQLTAVKKAADEDITVLGEELRELDLEVAGRELDDATRADYQRALDAYEAAKDSLAAVIIADEISNVTSILDDGRYAIACVRARLKNEPIPARRPPCFFNPQHGPSVRDVTWTPDGGRPRAVPACELDAQRVEAGGDPDSRKVMLGTRRVPYWEAGPAFGPFAFGYFGAFGVMNAIFMGTMMGAILGGGFDGSSDGGSADNDSNDNGSDDGASDSGDDGGGDSGGSDFDASGGVDSGGWDGGGGDFGGGDFGGGDFGGGDFGGGF